MQYESGFSIKEEQVNCNRIYICFTKTSDFMKFKEERFKQQLINAPYKLQKAAEAFEEISTTLGVEPVVTRVCDAVNFTNESGVHGQYRAIDFRAEYAQGGENLGYRNLYKPSDIKGIVEEMNRRFPRPDSKLTCIYHKVPGSLFHFHIQIPFVWLTKKERDDELSRHTEKR